MSTERFTDHLRGECGYDPEGDTGIDSMIAYKDALEDVVDQIDALALANSGHPEAAKVRNREGWVTLSAADVMAGVFELGLGKTPAERATTTEEK